MPQKRSDKRRQQYKELTEGISAVVNNDEQADKDDRATLRLLEKLTRDIALFTDPNSPKKATRKEMGVLFNEYKNILNGFKNLRRYKDQEQFKKLRRLMGKDMKMIYDWVINNPTVPAVDLVELYDNSRSLTVEVDEKTITAEGGSQNQRLHIVTKDEKGKKIDGYFTIHDKPFDIDREREKLAASIEDKEPVKSFIKYLLKDEGELGKGSYLTKYRYEKGKDSPASTIAAGFDSLDEYLKSVTVYLNTDVAAYIGEKGYNETSPEFKAIMDFKDKVLNSVEQMDKLQDTLLKGHQLYVKDHLCDVMKMEKQSRIDMRNSAMSMYAELLGIEDVLATSKNMRVKIGNETHKGTFMATAEGYDRRKIEPDSDILDVSASDLENVPELITSIANLQILDYLCGNTDRHTGNLTYKTAKAYGPDGKEKTVLVGIMGIDNDTSFMSGHKGVREDRMMATPFSHFLIIPKKTAHMILRMNPAFMRGLLAGFDLTSAEVEAALERLETVKFHIKEGIEYYRDHPNAPLSTANLKVVDDEDIANLSFSEDLCNAEKYGEEEDRTRSFNLFSRIRHSVSTAKNTERLLSKRMQMLGEEANDYFHKSRLAWRDLQKQAESLGKLDDRLYDLITKANVKLYVKNEGKNYDAINLVFSELLKDVSDAEKEMGELSGHLKTIRECYENIVRIGQEREKFQDRKIERIKVCEEKDRLFEKENKKDREPVKLVGAPERRRRSPKVDPTSRSVPQGKRITVDISLDDFLYLGRKNEISEEDITGQYSSLDTPEKKQQEFMRLMQKRPRSWEYVNKGGKDNEAFGKELDKDFPANIRNCGNISDIEKYLLDNQHKMPTRAKCVLLQRLQSLYKARDIKAEASGEDAQAVPAANLLVNGKIYIEGDSFSEFDKISLDIHQPYKQTSNGGCWSSSLHLMLQGHARAFVTPEDIRGYRANYNKQKLNGKDLGSGSDSDIELNVDKSQEIAVMSDAATAFAPDSMVRVFRIEPPDPARDSRFEKINKDDYVKKATDLTKKQIMHALTVDRSAIGINIGGHYVTITGIKGDTIYYKDSAGSPSDKETPKKIDKLVKELLIEKDIFIQLHWMSKIELAKDGKSLHGVPSGYVELQDDGTIKLPPKGIQDVGNQHRAPWEYENHHIGRFAGVEDTWAEQQKRNVFADGVMKLETVILPKHLNAAALKKRAAARSAEQEAELIKNSVKLYGADYVTGKGLSAKDKARYEKFAKAPAKDDSMLGTERKGGLEKPEELNAGADDFNIKKNSKKYKIDDFVSVAEENAITNRIRKEKMEKLSGERLGLLRQGLGLRADGTTDDMAPDGKKYIWYHEGAALAFQVDLMMKYAEPLLVATGRTQKLEELKEKYEKVKKLMRPISDEMGKDIYGFKDGGVDMPGVGKIDKCLPDLESFGEGMQLLEDISNSIDVRRDLKQKTWNMCGKGSYDKYDPSMLSVCADNLMYFSALERCNILRLYAKNPFYAEQFGKLFTPISMDKELLNKSKSVLQSEGHDDEATYLTHLTALRHLTEEENSLQSKGSKNIKNYQSRFFDIDYEDNTKYLCESFDALPAKYKDDISLRNMAYIKGEMTAKKIGLYGAERTLIGLWYAIEQDVLKRQEKGEDVSYITEKPNFKSLTPALENNASKGKKFGKEMCDRIMDTLVEYMFLFHDRAPFKFAEPFMSVADQVCRERYGVDIAKRVEALPEINKKRIEADNKRKKEREEQAREKEKRDREEQERKKEEEERKKKEEERKKKEQEERENAIKAKNEAERTESNRVLEEAYGKGPAVYVDQLLERLRLQRTGQLNAIWWETTEQHIKNLHLDAEGYAAVCKELAERKKMSYQELALRYDGTVERLHDPKEPQYLGVVCNDKELTQNIARRVVYVESEESRDEIDLIDMIREMVVPDKKLRDDQMDSVLVTDEDKAIFRKGRGCDELLPDIEGVEVEADENHVARIEISDDIIDKEQGFVTMSNNRTTSEANQRDEFFDNISQQNVKPDDMAEYAAKLIALYERKDDLNPFMFRDPQTIKDRDNEIKNRAESLLSSPDFRLYFIRLLQPANAQERLNALENVEGFVKGAVDFVDRISDIKKTIREDNTPVLTSENEETKTVDELQDMCKRKLSSIRDIKHLNYGDDLAKAAEFAALSYLASPGAKRMFFGKGTKWDDEDERALRDGLKAQEDGKYALADVNEAVAKLRDNLLEDECFLRAVSGGGSLKDVYEKYTDLVRRDINKKTREDEAARSRNDANHEVDEEETITLTDKDIKYIRKTLNELKTLYKSDGKYRSDYMVNLMTAMKNVDDAATEAVNDNNGSAEIEKSKVEDMMKHAQIYYKKRQGVIFNPVTDRGKSRLQVVENLIRKTEKMLKPAPQKAHDNGMKI